VAFPRTTLAAASAEDDLTFTLASAEGFPAAGPFGVQIDQELLTVVAGQGTTNWTVDRRQESKPYPPGTVVTGVAFSAPVSPRTPARLGYRYAAWALSHGTASAPPPIVADVPILPRILAFDAPAAVAPDTPFTLTWMLDEAGLRLSDTFLNGERVVAAQSATKAITRATTFDLTVTRRGVLGPDRSPLSSTRSVRVPVRRETVVLAGQWPVGMYVSRERNKLYVRCGASCAIGVLDITTRTVKMIGIPDYTPGYSCPMEGFAVNDRDEKPRLYALMSRMATDGSNSPLSAVEIDVETDSLGSVRYDGTKFRKLDTVLHMLGNGIPAGWWGEHFGDEGSFLKAWGATTLFAILPGGMDGGLHIVDYDF
jgi:hypothetical protein